MAMRRDDFIEVICSSEVAWPLSALTQQGPMPVIGRLKGSASDDMPKFAAGFQRGLKETGLIEGAYFAI